MNTDQRNKIEALLVKRGFNEQGMTKGLFIIPDGRNISADIRGEKPIVGVAIAGMIHTSGHGINAVQDIQNEVEAIMKSKQSQSPVTDLSAPLKGEAKGSNPASGGIDKAPELNKAETKPKDDVMKGAIPSESKLGAGDPPAKKGTTKATCPDCKTIFEISLDEARVLYDKYDGVYCVNCRDVSKVLDKEKCEEKPNGGTKMETEIVDQNQNLPATKKKQELVIGKCEAVAAQYGIPSEMANLFFMTMDGGLYIKNPGLLYLASKKGYSRIEVTTSFDEKAQEYSAECKIYPKLTKDILEGIGRLDPGLQKMAFEFATQPTNGTGRASKSNVRMSTMHPFLKEMSQTRAQNRALRAFTGYGGTSMEELPDAQIERD